MRKKFIAGNWKMNTTLPEATTLATGLVTHLKSEKIVDIAICVPYINITSVSQIVRGTPVKLGAQDLHWEEKGAYTGKISGSMLVSADVEYVIIGHSEQRTYFHETDETVNKKIKAALKCGLKPIVCIGETLDERRAGKVESVLSTQVRGATAGLSATDLLKCTIAYEPVWAIGTGENASPQQANEAHLVIRKVLSGLYSSELGNTIRIQYGGSMNDKNARELLVQPEVDGGLIGGASLKVESFAAIIAAAHI